MTTLEKIVKNLDSMDEGRVQDLKDILYNIRKGDLEILLMDLITHTTHIISKRKYITPH